MDGALYKRYDLSYTYSPNSGKSLLIQLDEVGKDGSTKLLLAKFSYVRNSIGFEAIKPLERSLPIPLTDRSTRIGDINGDGYPDLFRMTSTLIEVSLGSSSGWRDIISYSHSFGFNSSGANVRLGDVNGDSRDDIVKSTP